MAERTIKVWFDPEADFLEVMFEQKPGYFRPTDNDQVMEKVDDQGNVIGFSVLRVSSAKETPSRWLYINEKHRGAGPRAIVAFFVCGQMPHSEM